MNEQVFLKSSCGMKIIKLIVLNCFMYKEVLHCFCSGTVIQVLL